MNDAPAGAMKDEKTSHAEEISAVVEALLFSSDVPLPISKLSAVAQLPSRSVKQAVNNLNNRYERTGSAFRIEEIAGGYQMMTLPEYHDVLKQLLSAKKDSRLSQAALETLAIVAYRQPILRVDVETIRGVACGEVLRTLMERGLVKIVGRAEVIGRPMLYGTTKQFLEVFGLASLNDLPHAEALCGSESPKPAPSLFDSQDKSAQDENPADTEDEFENDEEFDEDTEEEEEE